MRMIPDFVEVGQSVLAEVGDVVGDLFLAELGVAGDALELLDVDRGVAVLLDQLLGDQDRVLEVVPFPGHEGDQHVLPQGQFPPLGGGPVGDDLAALDLVADLDDRLLVEAGVLVAADELDEVEDIDAGAGLVGFPLVDAHHDARRVDGLHGAVVAGDHRRPRVMGDDPLHAGADQRRIGAQQGDRLALHVGAHQRAVGVVVLEKRDHRRGDGDQLLGRDVHQLDLFAVHEHELAVLAGIDQLVDEGAVVVERGVGLGDGVPFLLESREVADLGGNLAVLDQPVGGLDEAVFVDPRVGGEGGDQADVRTLRGLDRADPAVVGRMYVAHLEAGTLAGQTTRSEGREAPLVGNLGERVGLVHELGELGGAEKLLDHRRDRLGVDQVVGHQAVHFLQAHALLDGALHAHQADPVLVLEQLADGAHPAVAEMVDIVDGALAVAQVDQVAHHLEDVLLGQGGVLQRRLEAQLVVELEAADGGKIVALGIEEEAVEEGAGAFQGRRIAGTQPPVDLDHRVVGGDHLVEQQSVAQVGTDEEVVDEQHLELVDAPAAQFLDLARRDLLVALDHHLAGGGIDDVGGGDGAEDVLLGDLDRLDPLLGELADRRFGELAVGLDDHLAVVSHHVKSGPLSGQQVEIDLLAVAFAVDEDGIDIVVVVEQLLGGVSRGP